MRNLSHDPIAALLDDAGSTATNGNFEYMTETMNNWLQFLAAQGARVDTDNPAEMLDFGRPVTLAALQAGFALPIRPREEGKYYYLGQVDVETLSLSDLEELQRWLQGDLATAVRGDENVGTAVGRGVHRMVVRMLGIPTKRFKVRTESFRVESIPPR